MTMNVDLLLFSDDEEDYDDDRSFFEIAIHRTQHKQQSSNDGDDDADEEEKIELRISFSSSMLLPITNRDVSKSHGQRDLLFIADHSDRYGQSLFSSDFSSSSIFSSSSVDVEAASPDLHEPGVDKTTAVHGQVIIAADPMSSEQKLTHLCSKWELTPACCPARKSSEKMTTPTVNKGSGILNFLIKFPAALKFKKLAKATVNTPSEQDIATITSKTRSSQRRRLHKFLKKSLNKWLVPIRNELGLKNMKSYCSFDDDHYEMDHIIVMPMKTKRKGISNPSSMKSSPVHQVQINSGGDDHHQSSIQAAIAHCRRSSTPDFCFSTSHLPS